MHARCEPTVRLTRDEAAARGTGGAMTFGVAVDAGWTFAPIVLLAIAGYAAAYTLRWRRARQQGGPRVAGYGRLALWWAGILGLFLALISPIDRLSEQLATVHMVQHLLLADI